MEYTKYNKNKTRAEKGLKEVENSHQINLRLDLWYIKVHAQAHMRNLGITYEESTPQSIMDSWWFWDCKNIPDPLPEELNLLKASPKKWRRTK